DNLKSSSIGALSLDPTDSTGQSLVAGTGQFSSLALQGDDLVGIYYTTDGGTTWTTSSGTNNNLTSNRITGVAARGTTPVVSTNSGGISGGLFRTTTGPGGTWTQISGTGGLPNAPANDIVGDPGNPNVLYVTFLGASGGVFKTTDLGATWTNVTGGIPFTS